MLEGLLGNTFTLWGILALCALGGLASERSGVVNIGLEGKMLFAACLTAVASALTGNALIGVLVAVGAGILLSLVHFVLTQTYRMDHIVSGMAINLFALGATNFLNGRLKAQLGEGTETFPVQVFSFVALAMGVAFFVALRYSRGGLRLLAVGDDPEKAREVGLQPTAIRWKALLVTGICCGLAGALVLSNTGTFSDNMTAGRGYIALAALILGGWKPIQTLLACLLFAALEAGQVQMQGSRPFGIEVPPEIWNATPYVVTLLALAGLLGRVRAPRGLGKP